MANEVIRRASERIRRYQKATQMATYGYRWKQKAAAETKCGRIEAKLAVAPRATASKRAAQQSRKLTTVRKVYAQGARPEAGDNEGKTIKTWSRGRPGDAQRGIDFKKAEMIYLLTYLRTEKCNPPPLHTSVCETIYG